MAKQAAQASQVKVAVEQSVTTNKTQNLLVVQLATIVIVCAVCAYLLWPRSRKGPEVHPPTVAIPTNINFILDTSASMQGYLNRKTELKDAVASLIAQLDKLHSANPQLKSIKYQFATDAGTLVGSGYDSREFIQRLLNDTLMNGQASLLQEVLRNATAETDRSTLSILITDSIFSYSDSEVKAHPEINKNNIAGLAALLTLTFNEAKSRGISVSLLAGRSQFSGKYYNYRNVAHSCCNAMRPYYVWLIGDRTYIYALLDYFRREGPAFDHQLDFNEPPIELPITVFPYTERRGTWYRDQRDKNHIEDVQADPAIKELRFAVALDLSGFGKERTTIDFLSQHLRVKSSGLQIKGSPIIRTKAEFENVIDHRDARRLPAYTHTLTITTDNSFAQHAEINIVIDDALPDWYLQWSNDDDSGNDSRVLATTFGLKDMIEGIAKAYRRSEPVAKATLRLDR